MAIEILLLGVFNKIKSFLSQNNFNFKTELSKIYFLLLINCYNDFLPILKRVINKSKTGAALALPGYYLDIF